MLGKFIASLVKQTGKKDIYLLQTQYDLVIFLIRLTLEYLFCCRKIQIIQHDVMNILFTLLVLSGDFLDYHKRMASMVSWT